MFVLLTFGDGTARVDSIQCKSGQESVGPKDKARWWRSVGVKCNETTGEYSLAPKKGSAGYSYAGLQDFCTALQRKFEDTIQVEVGKRILAVSFESPESRGFPIPRDENVSVWFREMLEPTISAAGSPEWMICETRSSDSGGVKMS